MRGLIKDGEKVILENVGLSLIQQDDTVWQGSFLLPQNRRVALGGRYRLELLDGRRGEIFIDHITERTGYVAFQGLGELS